MDELMEIGRFSKASGLSVAALRHYDEVGILKPAFVDPQTSYRRYHPTQLLDARRICSLRGVDLPIDEIRLVLNADRQTELDILQQHRRRLAERADRLEQMLATSKVYLDTGVPVPTPSGCRVVQVMVGTRDHAESVRFYRDVFDLVFSADISSFILGAYDTDSLFLLTIENWLDDDTPSAFGILVDDVDDRHARALAHGAREISPPADYSWKPRSSVIDDPSRNRIQLSQA
ncbi:MAG TPA: MerR family transcriptional regulator [Microlunatus sp.]|nr:MerR family transcriptional regulator [Microlunatus sp.]